MTNFAPRVRQRCQEVVEDPKKTIQVPVLQRNNEESNVWERICQELLLKLLYFRRRRRRICICLCDTAFLYTIHHFIVACLVACLLNESEVGGDLVLIETFLLLLC